MLRNKIEEIMQEVAMAYIDANGNEVSAEEFYGGQATDDESDEENSEDSSETEDYEDSDDDEDDEEEYEDEEYEEDDEEEDEEPEVQTPSFLEYNGKKYTQKEIEALEKGSLMQKDYTKKTQELSNQRKQFDRELQVVNAINNDPNLQTLISEYYKGNNKPNNVVKTESDKRLEYLEDVMANQMYSNNLERIKLSDDVIKANPEYLAEIEAVAGENNVLLDVAHKIWKADNMDKYNVDPKVVERETKKKVAQDLKKNKGKTKTLVKQGDKSVSKKKVQLSESQVKTKEIYKDLFKSDTELLKYADPNYSPWNK